ncbi:MAG: murein biosynthesis integral membrane protein MurJ [Acidimicrobiales bacterium]
MSRAAGRTGGQALGMAVGTLLSRATGLMRTVALAAALGVTTLGDAYNTANTAPNMIFQLAAGGVLTSAMVPLLVRHDDPRRRTEVTSVMLALVLAVGIVVSVVLVVCAPTVMRLLTLGARDRPDYHQFLEVGTSWLRIFAPQVALYAISVFATGVMQARGRLRLAGFAPILTNLVTIAAVVMFIVAAGGHTPALADIEPGQIRLLGWGTTLGVGAMAITQLWGAFRAEPGIRLFPRRLRDPVVGELRRLGGWVLVYVVVNQLGYAAVVAMANAVAGGITAYQWAFTLMQLPYAIAAVSLYSAAFPNLSRMAAGGQDVAAEVGRTARETLAILVPAAAGLGLLAPLLAEAVVGTVGAGLVAAGIAGFAFSLVPFSLFQLLTRTCYAFQDTKRPAMVNLAVNVVNVALAGVALTTASSATARITGLALSHAASYGVGCLLLRASLRRAGRLGAAATLRGTGSAAAASVIMASALAPAVVLVPALSSRVAITGVAVLLAAVGAVVYRIAAGCLGVALPRLIPRRELS